MEKGSPFKTPTFKNWLNEVRPNWDRVSIVLSKGSDYDHFGDPEMRFHVLSKVKSDKKRKSGEWIGDPSTMNKLKMPLSKMLQKDVKHHAPYILKHFHGDAKYGAGESFFWQQRVNSIRLKCHKSS